VKGFFGDQFFQLFFCLCFLVWLPYFFLRESIIGFDSYAYLVQACGKHNFVEFASGFLTNFLPCSFFGFKVVGLLLFVVFVLVCAIIVSHFSKKSVFLPLLLFFGLGPLPLYTFFKLENESFAIIPIFLATLFFYRAINKKESMNKPINYLISLAFIFLAAALWQGTFFYLAALGVAFLPFFILAAGISPFVGQRILDHLHPLGVLESSFGGISPLGFLVFPILFIKREWVFVAPLVLILD